MRCPRAAAAAGPILLLLTTFAASTVRAQSDFAVGGGIRGLSMPGVGAVRTPSDVTGGGIRGFYAVPTLTTRLEITNNANVSATNPQADVLLTVTPAIQLGGQSGRIRGSLDYALTGSVSANDITNSRFYNSLRGAMNAELVENRMFVDANASISQQSINPFGTLSVNPSLNNPNATEVLTVAVSPYIEGLIAGRVNYLGRAYYTYTNSGTSQASDSSRWGGLLRFDSPTRWARIGWALDFSYNEVDFTEGRSTFDQLNLASLNFALSPALQVSLRGNVETSNVVSFNTETSTGWGGGLRWNPSPRTNLLVEYDQRIFGSSHVYSFAYRARRSVWLVSSRQSLSTGQRNPGGDGPLSARDLLYEQFAAIEPDPVKRAQLVDAFLQSNGIDPNVSLNMDFLPSQVQLRNSNEASAALLGIRSTVIFNVYQTKSQNLGPLSLPDNNFANGNEITWIGYGVVWSHRLSPRSTINLSARQQDTSQPVTNQDTTLRTASALWSYQASERATLAVRGRYTVQSGTSRYNEAALMGILTMRF